MVCKIAISSNSGMKVLSSIFIYLYLLFEEFHFLSSFYPTTNFPQMYSKICSYYLNWSLGKWLLEALNEGKKPKIWINFKNTLLSNKNSFQKKR